MALSDSERVYCLRRAEGAFKYVAWQEANPSCHSRNSAQVQSCKLEKRPDIQAEIQRLRDATETASTLQRQEKREFLARVVRTPISELSEDDPICEQVETYHDKDGCLVRKKFKKRSLRDAIELDNRLAGHNEPEEVSHTHGGGVMLIPAAPGSVDAWEKQAVEAQARLKDEAESRE